MMPFNGMPEKKLKLKKVAQKFSNFHVALVMDEFFASLKIKMEVTFDLFHRHIIIVIKLCISITILLSAIDTA